MPGRPSFRQVLEAVREAWLERRDAVEQNAGTLARNWPRPARRGRPAGRSAEPARPGLLAEAVAALARSEDTADGGFGAAPKFPPSAVLEFLIRHAAVAASGHRGRLPGTWRAGRWRRMARRRCSTSSTAASPATR